MATSETTPVKGAYWSPVLQPENEPNIAPRNISSTYFTHLFYASLVPDPRMNYKLNPSQTEKEWMRTFTDILHGRPRQKALLSIGARNENPNIRDSVCNIFSNMANVSETRNSFIKSSIDVARMYNFDGLDLDWEFPGREDMGNLSSLFQEWHDAIVADHNNSQKPQLLLSAAVYYANSVDGRAYPIDAINRNVDFVTLRCYDYHGSWNTSVTGEHSCLCDSRNPQLNTEYGITSWLTATLLPQKLVVGLPLFGKTWNLINPDEHGVGDSADGVGPGVNGVMRYYEILDYNSRNNGMPGNDLPTRSIYSYAGKTWIGYDNEKTIKEKVHFTREKGLRGYFLWALGYDNGDILARTGIFFFTQYILMLRNFNDSFIFHIPYHKVGKLQIY